MKILFHDAMLYDGGEMKKANMLFDGTSLSLFEGDVSRFPFTVIDNTVILPGFCDVHVHLREPGFSYKETVASGTAACAAGGYTAVCAMPNLNPTPDTREHLDEQLGIIERDAVIKVLPYGAITVGEKGEALADLADMAESVAGFSDDGRGVQNAELMKAAMLRAGELGLPIGAHCEDNSLLNGGYIHDGEYARAHRHRGICSESEWGPIKRDVEMLRELGSPCKYHVCHVSTKESVEVIREAKKSGLDVSAETAPHYILLDDSMLEEDGRFKMNPPLRSPEDRRAILEGILDGTLDCIATDHAPHTEEEKSKGLAGSMMGVVGIETAFPLLYTHLVKEGIMTLPELVEIMSVAPRKRFGITSDPGFTVFDVSQCYKIDPEEFISKGKSTPFRGASVYGRCLLTVYEGKAVYSRLDTKASE